MCKTILSSVLFPVFCILPSTFSPPLIILPVYIKYNICIYVALAKMPLKPLFMRCFGFLVVLSFQWLRTQFSMVAYPLFLSLIKLVTVLCAGAFRITSCNAFLGLLVACVVVYTSNGLKRLTAPIKYLYWRSVLLLPDRKQKNTALALR